MKVCKTKKFNYGLWGTLGIVSPIVGLVAFFTGWYGAVLIAITAQFISWIVLGCHFVETACDAFEKRSPLSDDYGYL